MNENTQRILMFLGGVILTLLIVLIIILLTRDGDGTATDSSATSTTTEESGDTSTAEGDSSTTAADGSSTTEAVSTTAAPGTTAGACAAIPGLEVPPDALDGPTADFDGNGTADRLVTFPDGFGGWWVAIELSYGYAQGSAVTGPADPRSVYNFGPTPVGFARVDSGASTEFIGAVYMVGCNVYEATVQGGALARFALGGSVTHLDGMSCEGDQLRTKSASTSDGTTWEYTETLYDFNNAFGEFVAVTSSIQLLTSPADDATIFAAASYDC